ncbi:A disintegrin and metalloproteinase with thrombospondin motifs 18-like [Saccostrea cucullata]|uniref:A disintegrin and metalloproteinase with thrombospondin motifs 18-like n=1 Tax=Saccostrea cuccullata TaxID=36930 RepID=UPI002ED686B1
MEAIDISSLKELNKDKKRGLSPTELSLSAFGEDYQLQVAKPEPVLHPEVRIVTRNDDGDQEWKGVIPDCFLVGHVTSHNGTASLSHCEGLPSYNNSFRVNIALHTFCEIVYDNPIKYDIFYLHSGRRPTDVGGRAWKSGACQRTKCGADRGEVVAHASTTHELGHMLGMSHDKDAGCTGSDTGVMGGQGTRWSSCSIRDFDKFLQKEGAQCLFREDVSNSANYGPLEPVLMGQKYSADEICELNYGPNFHYRNFSYLPPCDVIYSCVDYNEGELFGRMFTKYISGPQGIYCDTGKICLYRTCQTFAEAKVKPGVVRPGGWGPWTDWRPCSRTCGTGLTYRRRLCNSPSPLNHPGCEGGDDNGYEARTCNPEPCPNDSSDINTLINQRASETCSRMLKNKVLDSTKYTSVGRKMDWHGHLKCEVKCESVPGYRTYSYDRFGLIPQGTPCEGLIEEKDKPWSEYSFRCLDGYCRFFGCNGELNAKYDVCGVCKGDGTTCDVVKGSYTETTARCT